MTALLLKSILALPLQKGIVSMLNAYPVARATRLDIYPYLTRVNNNCNRILLRTLARHGTLSDTLIGFVLNQIDENNGLPHVHNK